jgi:serine protease
VKRRIDFVRTVVVAALLLSLGPVPAQALASGPAAYEPGELIVKYREGTTRSEREQLRRSAGVRFAGMVGDSSQRVEVTDGATTLDTAAALERDSRVAYARPNYIARSSAFTPNDPGRTAAAGGWTGVQWNFLDSPAGARIQVAWDNAIRAGKSGGVGVVIAVLDTGVAYRTDGQYKKSPDLARRRFVRGHDFVRANALPFDRNGHGTFITGTIAQSTNNGVGVTGIAYRSRIMPVRVLDFEGKGDVATIASGIRYAVRRKAKVINMSFEFDIGLTASQIPDVISAIRYAHRKGSVLVAAAGNAEDTRVAYPALARNVIAVGATTEHGCLAEYSNTGQGLDLVAPGGGADAALPGDPNCRPFEGAGRDIFQFTFLGSSFSRFGLPFGYEGTSMAVPHVSGTIALMLGMGILGPNPTPLTIEQRLEATARDLGAPGYDTNYGAGLLDAAAATTPPAPAPAPG